MTTPQCDDCWPVVSDAAAGERTATSQARRGWNRVLAHPLLPTKIAVNDERFHPVFH